MAQRSVLRIHADLFGLWPNAASALTCLRHRLPLTLTQDSFAAAVRRLAVEDRIWVWPKAKPTADPAVQRVELSVGDATCALEPDQVRGIIAALIGSGE